VAQQRASGGGKIERGGRIPVELAFFDEAARLEGQRLREVVVVAGREKRPLAQRQ